MFSLPNLHFHFMTYFKRSQDDTVPQLHIAVGNLVTEQLDSPFSLCHTSHESNLNIERISYHECTELQIHREFHIMDGHNPNYIYLSSLTGWANAQICSLSDWIKYKLNRNGQMLAFSWAQIFHPLNPMASAATFSYQQSSIKLLVPKNKQKFLYL